MVVGRIGLLSGAAALLALGASGWAWRWPRQALLRSIERYRIWPRRRADEASAARAAIAEPGDWLLTGTDRLGRPIRLVVALRHLVEDDQGLVIGRSRQIADLVLGDASVSRRHARIVRTDDGIALIDLKSKRGSWVDSRRLEPYAKPALVVAGTFVRFGTVTLAVERA